MGRLRLAAGFRTLAGRILRDEIIVLRTAAALADYPEVMRRITALVEVDGQSQEMVFLTNNLEWSPASVADLYRNRWSIEAFFKQIKQTLQLADFLGHSANAVRWQVWTALLVYVLLRFLAFVHSWQHKLHPSLYPSAERPLAALGPRQLAAMLWDSVGCLPLYSYSAAA